MKNALLIMFFALLFMACGDSTDDLAKYLISGNMGTNLFDDGSLQLTITQLETGAVGADQATVTLNDVELDMLPGSDELFATFILNHIEYTANKDYNVRVSIDGNEAVCNLTTPGIRSVTIQSPLDEGYYTPGEELSVRWSYDGGGFPDHITIIADDEHEGDQDTTWDYSQELDGIMGYHNIPGSVTADFEGMLWISLDPGEFFYEFEGGGSSIGSGITIVLASDWITLYGPSASEDIGNIDIEVFDSSLPADGISETTIEATVYNTEGNIVGDGIAVDFSSTLGTVSPSRAYTWGGVATATFTAGNEGGSAIITAAAGGQNQNATIELEPVVSISVAVSSGSYPVISWTPEDARVRGMNVGQLGAVTPKWSIFSTAGFPSPVTYGTLPTGAKQVIPIMGGTPDGLEDGFEYRITLIAEDDDTTFFTFTR